MISNTTFAAKLLSSLMLLGSLISSCTSPVSETTFFTEGNCLECKSIIESTLMEADGVRKVIWDFETSITTVYFNPNKTNEDNLQEIIAEKGFETTFFPANSKSRLSLPACCQEQLNRKLKSTEGNPHH